MLPQLQAGGRRPTAGFFVPRAAGGAELGGRRRVRFTNLRAGLSQQGQWTLLSIQLQKKHEIWVIMSRRTLVSYKILWFKFLNPPATQEERGRCHW